MDSVFSAAREITCNFYSVPIEFLDLKSRKREVVWCRQVAMYLVKKHFKYSLADIGYYIAKKDHCTVLHSCKAVNNLMDTDNKIKESVQKVEGLFLEAILSKENGLDFKYLSIYLPYKLWCMDKNGNKMRIYTGTESDYNIHEHGILTYLAVLSGKAKPILRPLDLKKNIEVNGKKFTPQLKLSQKLYEREPENFDSFESCQLWIEDHLGVLKEPKGYDNLLHWIFQDLVKWHFDLFDLYNQGFCVYYDEIS